MDSLLGIKRWLTALFVAGYSTALLGAGIGSDTAQYHGPIPPDKTAKLFKALQISRSDAGVYYIPPADAEQRGYIFDDIPREGMATQAQLTENRIKKQGTFVKFNSRQISYSFYEDEDNSVRLNYYPRHGVMMNWTYAFSILGH